MSLLDEAIKALKIQDVTLRKCHVDLNDSYDPDDIEADEYDIESFSGCGRVSEVAFESEDGQSLIEYRFVYHVGIRLTNKDIDEVEEVEDMEESDIPFFMTATFSANYLSKTHLEENVLKAFSQNNVGYHVWPYWREFVQSSISRVGIDPITIPFYRCNN